MSDHHTEAADDRLFFFEQQEITVQRIDAAGFILDVGGGGEGIIGRLNGEQVIAIDPNRRELEEAPSGPLKIVMDAADLMFLDGTFSVVTAFFTLMYIDPDKHKAVFEEVYRVLVPGGRFLVWDVECPPRGDEKKEIMAFPMAIKLPGDSVSTGYGARWPVDGREMPYYLQLARAAGFVVAAQECSGQTYCLELLRR